MSTMTPSAAFNIDNLKVLRSSIGHWIGQDTHRHERAVKASGANPDQFELWLSGDSFGIRFNTKMRNFAASEDIPAYAPADNSVGVPATAAAKPKFLATKGDPVDVPASTNAFTGFPDGFMVITPVPKIIGKAQLLLRPDHIALTKKLWEEMGRPTRVGLAYESTLQDTIAVKPGDQNSLLLSAKHRLPISVRRALPFVDGDYDTHEERGIWFAPVASGIVLT